MWFGIVTLFPEMFAVASSSGVLGRALDNGVLELELFNPRDYTEDKHRTVDDRPYGGGPGMVMMVEPLLAAVAAAKAANTRRTAGAGAGEDSLADATSPARVIYLSPQGSRLDQAKVQALSRDEALILVAGRYEGIDERVIEIAVDEELSIGDYVLTGGELPAMVLLDALARQVPGTLGNRASAADESHLDGSLDYPHYTRPENTGGGAVPAVLLSGDHAAIRRWRRKAALEKTWRRRPDLLAGQELSEEDLELLKELLAEGLADDQHRSQ